LPNDRSLVYIEYLYTAKIFPPQAMARAKPSQSQAKANPLGLAWRSWKPKPPKAKPKPLASRPSQARTSLVRGGALVVVQRPGGKHRTPEYSLRCSVPGPPKIGALGRPCMVPITKFWPLERGSIVPSTTEFWVHKVMFDVIFHRFQGNSRGNFVLPS
jgi:hypothetical protein